MAEYTKYPLTKEPVDRVARRVTAPSIDYGTRKKIAIDHWRFETEFRLRKVPFGMKDWTGYKYGRFTVVGLLAEKRKYAMWVCRCSCGDFEPRKAKALVNKKNSKDRCHKCRQIEELRRMNEYKVLGFNYDNLSQESRG